MGDCFASGTCRSMWPAGRQQSLHCRQARRKAMSKITTRCQFVLNSSHPTSRVWVIKTAMSNQLHGRSPEMRPKQTRIRSHLHLSHEPSHN